VAKIRTLSVYLEKEERNKWFILNKSDKMFENKGPAKGSEMKMSPSCTEGDRKVVRGLDSFTYLYLTKCD